MCQELRGTICGVYLKNNHHPALHQKIVRILKDGFQHSGGLLIDGQAPVTAIGSRGFGGIRKGAGPFALLSMESVVVITDITVSNGIR